MQPPVMQAEVSTVSKPAEIPRTHAEILCSALDAVRGETAMLKVAGLLHVSADDLLDGGAIVHRWLADLATSVKEARGDRVRLPVRDAGELQQVVYGLSPVLVWADELRRDGRLATRLPFEALAAWAEVERIAGLGGRTAKAVGMDPAHPYREVSLPEVEAASGSVPGAA